jgi:biopolymer transport protein ExbD
MLVVLLNNLAPRKKTISITPLIDVVFILLLFFMLSSTFNQKKQLEIKHATLGVSQAEGETVQIVLQPEGVVEVDGAQYRVGDQPFAQLLNTIAENDSHVRLSARASVSVQNVVELIDMGYQAGITQLNLSESVE